MSTFVYLLVTIGIVAVKYYLEQKSKTSASTTPGDVLTEVFPMQSEQDDEETEAKETEIHTIEQGLKPTITHQTSKAVSIQNTPTTSVKANISKTKPTNEETDNCTSDKLNLSKRDEARRAFIYSEIFSRKYE